MTDTSAIAQQGLASDMMMQRKLDAVKSSMLDTASGDKNQAHARARKVAEDFEAMFITQMLQPMFADIPVDESMGGGHAEKMFRTMMVDEMGKSMARSGGIGLADNIFREILKMQEAPQK